MLAVFEKSIAKSPDALKVSGDSEAASALNNGFLATHFATLHPGSVTVNLGSSGFMAYSLDKQNPLLPRLWFSLFLLSLIKISLLGLFFWTDLILNISGFPPLFIVSLGAENLWKVCHFPLILTEFSPFLFLYGSNWIQRFYVIIGFFENLSILVCLS